MYCLCDQNKFSLTCSQKDHDNYQREAKIIQMYNELYSRRKPRYTTISLYSNLKRLNWFLSIMENDSIVYFGKIKTKTRVNASAKRTSYYGVSKNGPHWQSLISINKKKTYVGTFMTEKEAAEAYDFYSMVLKCETAQTNFSYTKEQAQELVSKYSYLIDRK